MSDSDSIRPLIVEGTATGWADFTSLFPPLPSTAVGRELATTRTGLLGPDVRASRCQDCPAGMSAGRLIFSVPAADR